MTVEPSEAQIGTWIAKACKENPDGSMLRIAKSVAQSAYAHAYALKEGQNAEDPLALLQERQAKVQCWCQACCKAETGLEHLFLMAVCPTCGNKRCPKASDHMLECTGSNEPGQPGSLYSYY